MSESQQKLAVTIGIPVARRHIFLCAEQTKPKCCDMERGVAAWEYLKRRLKELGLSEHGGIPVARRHIFLCAEQTKPKCCDMERGVAAWEYLKRRLKELGLSEQGGI